MRKLLVLLSVLAMQAISSATVCNVAETGVHAQWDSWTAGEPFDGYNTFTPDNWCYDTGSVISIGNEPDALVYRDMISFVESLDGRDGILLLEGIGFENMDFFLPNFAGDQGGNISVQVTYKSIGFTPVIGINPYINDELVTEGIYRLGCTSHTELEDGWFSDIYEFTVFSNPGYEYITLGFENDGRKPIVAVDSVIIDTVSMPVVPEPATLCFMALGSLVMLRKHK